MSRGGGGLEPVSQMLPAAVSCCAVAMERGTAPRPLFLLLLLTAIVTAAGQAVDDACKSNEVCRLITDCPEARDALRKGVTPTTCSFQGFQPVVCCPAPSPSPTPTPTPTTTTTTPPPAPETPERVATRMCTKYADAVYLYVETFQIPKRTEKWDKCAIKGIPFIVNGVAAIADEFPHMALLGYGDNAQQPKWACGGSLISERFVLTAAHCFNRGIPKVVRLGELNLKATSEPNPHQDFGVAQAIPHPDYVDGVNYNDVALLRLSRDVVFTPSIRPLCLQVDKDFGRPAAIASGWGYTDWANPVTSDQLMKVRLPIQENEVCQDAYKTLSTTARLRRGIDEETMICAGALGERNDTCSGDSGGPLQIGLKVPYCMYSAIGITSFGRRNCGMGKGPAVYTRVSHYVPWIESIVWPNEK